MVHFSIQYLNFTESLTCFSFLFALKLCEVPTWFLLNQIGSMKWVPNLRVGVLRIWKSLKLTAKRTRAWSLAMGSMGAVNTAEIARRRSEMPWKMHWTPFRSYGIDEEMIFEKLKFWWSVKESEEAKKSEWTNKTEEQTHDN